MKKLILTVGLAIPSIIASAIPVDLYFYPAAEDGDKQWTNKEFMYYDGATKVLSSPYEQFDQKGNAANLIFDWTVDGYKNANGVQFSAGSGKVTVQNLTATGCASSYFNSASAKKEFYGIKSWGGTLTVLGNFTVNNGFFMVKSAGIVDSAVVIGGKIVLDTSTAETTLHLGAGGAINAAGPIATLSVGSVANASGDKVSVDATTGTKNKSLYLNVGRSSTYRNDADATFNGIIDASGSKMFMYVSNRGSVAGSSAYSTISTQGIKGNVNIRNLNPSGSTATNMLVTSLVFTNELGKSYTMSGFISDGWNATDGWKFEDYIKTSVVMDGPGTQIFTSTQMFSGGITVKQGTFLVSGIASGANDTAYTHGNLSLEGGTFGFASVNTAGVYTFNDAYVENGNIKLGAHSSGFDQIQLVKLSDSDGRLQDGTESGNGTLSVEIFGDDIDISSNFVDKSARIVTWSGYDDSISYVSENVWLFGVEYKANFTTGADGLYMQYIAVPEPAAVVAFFGLFALGGAVLRRRK